MTLPLPALIETPRLRLRPPTLDDAVTLFERYTQDAEVCRFLLWRPHASLDETHGFIESCLQRWGGDGPLPYVIGTRDDDSAIGMIEARPLGTAADIGYVLARSHWGRGLMPEAIAALTGALLACPGLWRVQAACDAENRPSQRALEKAGFALEGRLARYGVFPNLAAEPRDCLMYARWR